ncbi:NCS2 family permease [Desulfoluna spongiiphila]|uniref:Putative MFS transporter, AGZA family, xanthine/uracil permease n=1 Tax=Desulfoluna spongiiphila TaxID=419481 RepID=A0A1G5F3B4_9BACT|nr:NCS2 family permease [Desulfoluna spongiiphila]SCY33697.1 putative MFS transporter, AGZA family, xanthine/uracil permease [Desulfoluna spongiiphila]VVS94341.1 xanthine/uracil/vitamin c permease [Desulfoluna spongiiphila]
MLENFFKLKENGTDVRTEVIAGLTTFMTMAYILAVNPDIMSATGMDKGALFTATALSALVATLVMALVAKLPFALAPGMGLNAFFAFTVVLNMGYSWEMALTAVFIEGLIFIVLTFFNVREAIINAIPISIKNAVSVGIGLFIALIGLKGAGVIVRSDPTLVTLGNMADHTVWVAFIGIIVSGTLLALNKKGALLAGIVVATLVGIPLGVTNVEGLKLFSAPPSLEPIMFKFDFSKLFTTDMAVVLFTFLFIDMFDTVGTLVGVGAKAGLLDEKGRLPGAKQALFADAIGTTFGACMGTSTVTTYVESASGVAEGGRTGLTSLTTAGLFFVALFMAPLFLMIPAAATAPALVMVGFFMLSPIKNIDLDDATEALPAFITFLMMPLTYSISEGIVFGMLSYVILKVLSGKAKTVSPVMYIIAVIFVLKFFM